MMTDAQYKANFADDYTRRTAGKMPEIKDFSFSKFFGESSSTKTAAAETSKSDETSFGDMVKNGIDIINPLQHIPIVSSIYRLATNDDINTGAKVAGDTIYGGIFGGLISLATSAYQYVTGEESDNTETKTASTSTADAPVASETKLKDISSATTALQNYQMANNNFGISETKGNLINWNE